MKYKPNANELGAWVNNNTLFFVLNKQTKHRIKPNGTCKTRRDD
jgi:hypothetical protein